MRIYSIKLPLLFLLCIFYYGSQAQNTAESPSYKIFLHSGVHYTDYEQINSVLKENAYPVFRNANFSGGFTLWIPFSRVVAIADLYIINQASNSNGRSSVMKTHNGGASLGYNLLKESNFEITPYMGLLYNYTQINLTDEHVNTSNNIGSFLNEEPLNYSLIAERLIGNFGIYANYEFPINLDRGMHLSIGIQAGFQPGFDNLKWSTPGTHNLKGPDGEKAAYISNIIFGFAF